MQIRGQAGRFTTSSSFTKTSYSETSPLLRNTASILSMLALHGLFGTGFASEKELQKRFELAD